jgi:hypothetical protein
LPFSRFTDTSGSLPVRWRLRLVLILFIIVSTWTGIALCPLLNPTLVSSVANLQNTSHQARVTKFWSTNYIRIWRLTLNYYQSEDFYFRQVNIQRILDFRCDAMRIITKMSTKSFSSLTPSAGLAVWTPFSKATEVSFRGGALGVPS